MSLKIDEFHLFSLPPFLEESFWHSFKYALYFSHGDDSSTFRHKYRLEVAQTEMQLEIRLIIKYIWKLHKLGDDFTKIT